MISSWQQKNSHRFSYPPIIQVFVLPASQATGCYKWSRWSCIEFCPAQLAFIEIADFFSLSVARCGLGKKYMYLFASLLCKLPTLLIDLEQTERCCYNKKAVTLYSTNSISSTNQLSSCKQICVDIHTLSFSLLLWCFKHVPQIHIASKNRNWGKTNYGGSQEICTAKAQKKQVQNEIGRNSLSEIYTKKSLSFCQSFCSMCPQSLRRGASQKSAAGHVTLT